MVLVVCPNVTIRDRLQGAGSRAGEASLYRTRDLVPGDLMPDADARASAGTNWHVFEPQTVDRGRGQRARLRRPA